MGSTLKVLISGTGFAGQGHTDAFRNAGAEVVEIVGRTSSVLRQRSDRYEFDPNLGSTCFYYCCSLALSNNWHLEIKL